MAEGGGRGSRRRGGGAAGKGECLLMRGQCVMHVWNDMHVQASRLSQQPSVEPGSIQGHVEVPLKRYFIGVSLINKQIQQEEKQRRACSEVRSGRRIA